MAGLVARLVALSVVGFVLFIALPIALKMLFSMGVFGMVIAIVGFFVVGAYCL